jgi:hypothetical protein
LLASLGMLRKSWKVFHKMAFRNVSNTWHKFITAQGGYFQNLA